MSKVPVAKTSFDEVNIARLGLISVQRNLPDDATRWVNDFVLEGRKVRITCEGSATYGVPRGIDNDVSAAVVNLFLEQGSSPLGSVHFTLHQLLKAAGLATSARYYQAVRESLMRLTTTSYFITDNWRDHGKGKWITVSFRYFDKVEFTGSHADSLDDASLVRITLPRELVHSIRAGFLKPLNLDLMRSLTQPTTRALYRLLDAQRHSVETLEATVTTFEVNLLEWAKLCRISEDRPSKIRRSLDPAHEELVNCGYLSTVTYLGRGKKQTVTYVFSAAGAMQESERQWAEKLQELGISRAVSEKLVSEYGNTHIESRVARFQALLQGGYRPRSKSAVLIDVIQDTSGKYTDVEPLLTVASVASRKKVSSGSTEVSSEEEARQTQLESLLRPEQVERVFSTLKILLKAFSLPELTLLREYLLVREPGPLELVRELVSATAQKRMEGVSEALRQELLAWSNHPGRR